MVRTYAEWRAEWRADISFTDAEIIAALRAEATEAPNEFLAQRYTRLATHLERTGRLSRVMLRLALPRLIITCWVCGGRALYRLGSVGMCRKHKFHHPPEARAWRREQDRNRTERAAFYDERDRRKTVLDHAVRSKQMRHHTYCYPK